MAYFNYHRSSPCIFLELEQVEGWIPEYYDPNDLPMDMPQQLKHRILSINNTEQVRFVTIYRFKDYIYAKGISIFKYILQFPNFFK